MRIGELAAATGVNAATLRAWERRHGILRPQRTTGGHRVYGADDVARVRAVVSLVEGGTGLAAALDRLSSLAEAPSAEAAAEARTGLWDSIDAFDEQGTRRSLAAATTALGVPALFDDVLVPVLRRLGEGWRLSPRNVAREHFTSTLVRAHLVTLLSTPHEGPATCVAFCPDGEQHDLGLLMATATVAKGGARAVVLGAHTPPASVEVVLRELRPTLVLVAATSRRTAARLLAAWRPRRGRFVVAGGTGFRPVDAEALGGHVHAGAYADLPSVVRGALG